MQVMSGYQGGERLGLDEEVADRVAAQGLRLIDELAPSHVDADPMILLLEGCPVEAQTAFEFVEAALPEHDVVAAEALHAVAFGAAIEDVVAGDQRNLAGGRALVADQQIAVGAAIDPVVALVALKLVGIFATEDDVVAQAAADDVDALAAIDEVVAVAAEDVIVTDA